MKRKLKYGDMLQMYSHQMGHVLYMVVNPPIICEHCKNVIHGWEQVQEFKCPKCDQEIHEFQKQICKCGEYDLIELVVAADNNFGLQSDGEMFSYNRLVNRLYCHCLKDVEKEIESGKLKVLTDEEAVMKKRLIAWTSQDNYEPGKEMPKWIEEMFPMKSHK